MQFSIIPLLPSTALAPTTCSLHRCHSLDYNQVFKFRKLLPCPCTAPCSELPGSGWAAWAAVACTPPERKSQKKRGDDEALPQRDRYVMERLMRTTLREESGGGGEEEERLSHTRRRRERGGRSVREKAKVFHSCTETDCLIWIVCYVRHRDYRRKLSGRLWANWKQRLDFWESGQKM